MSSGLHTSIHTYFNLHMASLARQNWSTDISYCFLDLYFAGMHLPHNEDQGTIKTFVG